MLLRFDRVERAAHWANATLFLVLIGTGAILYIGPLSILVGRRVLIDDIHVYCGLALPVPLLISLAGSWGKGLRADLSRFNRWTADDRRWLRLSSSRVRSEKRPGSTVHREVQPRPETQRRVRRRGHRGHAGHRRGHALVQPVAAVVAHRRHLRPPVARHSGVRGDTRPHHLRPARPGSSALHVQRHHFPALGAATRPRLGRRTDSAALAAKSAKEAVPDATPSGKAPGWLATLVFLILKRALTSAPAILDTHRPHCTNQHIAKWVAATCRLPPRPPATPPPGIPSTTAPRLKAITSRAARRNWLLS